MTGSNQSKSIGSGQEFSQYRNYEPGDDLRQLDWKIYARSERYFVKQAEIETNITVKFVLDASRSMAYQENNISKLLYAKFISAALAYLARKQGDRYGLYTVNNENISIVRPRYEQQQFMRFLHELVVAKAESKWTSGGIDRLLDHQGKELIVFITDLYDEKGDLLHFINKLKTSRNEVIIFHIMGAHEMTLDHAGAFTFKDLESGETAKVDTVLQQNRYTQKVHQWIADTRLALLEKNITYHLIQMDGNIEQVLRDFLKRRKQLMR